MVVSALFGVTIGEILDEKIEIPYIEDSAADIQPTTECAAANMIIAYMANGDKYYGKCSSLGPSCKLTKSEEILTEIG